MSNLSFNSLLQQMAEKCGGYAKKAAAIKETPVKDEVKVESPTPEPKNELPDEMPSLPCEVDIQEPTPGPSTSRILSTGEILEPKDPKVEPKEEPGVEGSSLITAQIVNDMPLKISAPPPGMRKIVIKSNGNGVYSAPARQDDDSSWRPRYPVHIADKANDFCYKFEREMMSSNTVQKPVQQPLRGVFTVRRPLPNILRPTRPVSASMALKNHTAPYYLPNQLLRGQFFQKDRQTRVVSFNGRQWEKPEWTYPNMIALCILCSEFGYVNTPELYNFIEFYFPWYDTNVTRSYRSSLRNALSRFCDKYLPEQNGHRCTSWTLRDSRLQSFKNEINRYIKKEHATRGVNDFNTLVTKINWERPAVVADHEATNPRFYRQAKRFDGGAEPDEAAIMKNAMYSANQRLSGESSSVSREVSPDEEDMFKQIAYYDSDQEYEVEPAEVDDAEEYDKPEWKHPHMLAVALLSFGDGCGTVQDLYDFITKYFPYYATTAYWKSSARNSLCNSKYFTKFEDERHNVHNRSCLYKIREDQVQIAILDVFKWMGDPTAQVGVRDFEVLKSFMDQKVTGTEDFGVDTEFGRRLQAGQRILESGEIMQEDIKDIKVEE